MQSYKKRRIKELKKQKKHTCHICHLIMCFFTGGLWLLVWAFLILMRMDHNSQINEKIDKIKYR